VKTRTIPCPTCGADRTFASGRALRRIRMSAGLTLRDLAESIDLSPQYLCDVESNRRPAPEKIVRAYARLGSA
jgi:transcriptional regulator with XRE-family HTH domain